MEPINEQRIAQNYQRVLERIDLAARRAGRNPSSVRLVVVSKTQPAQAIAAVVAAGARQLGENYAEEVLPKKAALPELPGVEWHMIGHVQSRKAELVCEHFQYLHSLDSLKLAQRLDRFASQLGRRLPALLECNVSGEAAKSGFAAWQETDWDALLPEFEQIAALPGLSIRGLMTMPPFSDDPEAARPTFRTLQRLQAFLTRRLPAVAWLELSMGMSADFETAIEEGATWVRVGQAIFGPREVRPGEGG